MEIKISCVENLNMIRIILNSFDMKFKPSLLEIISNLDEYSKKIYDNGIMLSASLNDEIIGFISFYANDKHNQTAYINLFAIKDEASKNGLSKVLLNSCVEVSKNNGMTQLKLEVGNRNTRAINFYKKNAFEFYMDASEDSKYMIKKL